MPDGRYDHHDFVDHYVLDDGGLVIRRATTFSRYAPGGWWEITEYEVDDD